MCRAGRRIRTRRTPHATRGPTRAPSPGVLAKAKGAAPSKPRRRPKASSANVVQRRAGNASASLNQCVQAGIWQSQVAATKLTIPRPAPIRAGAIHQKTMRWSVVVFTTTECVQGVEDTGEQAHPEGRQRQRERAVWLDARSSREPRRLRPGSRGGTDTITARKKISGSCGFSRTRMGFMVGKSFSSLLESCATEPDRAVRRLRVGGLLWRQPGQTTSGHLLRLARWLGKRSRCSPDTRCGRGRE